MKTIPQPETVTVYQLVKMTGMIFSAAGNSGNPSMGIGFYTSLQEAEHNRTICVLGDSTTAGPKPTWHIFELEFPNPAIVK